MAMASSSPEGFKQAGSIVRLKFINFMQVVCFDFIFGKRNGSIKDILKV